MKSLVLFDATRCREYSPDTPLSDLPLAQKSIFVDAAPGHFSTIGINPVRIGDLPNSHVSLKDTTAAMAIYPDGLDVLDDSHIYLNGRKLEIGKHAMRIGDSL